MYKKVNGAQIASSFLFVFLFVSSGISQDKINFTSNERTIIYSVLNQFKVECSHIAALDESKLKDIQNLYQTNREKMTEEQNSCYGEHLSQLVATHNIHKQTCDEITPKKNYGKNKELARLFVNVRKFQSGIRVFHEKLNECLIRNGVDSKGIISFSDFEKNGRLLSKKIREADVQIPFRENSVNYR